MTESLDVFKKLDKYLAGGMSPTEVEEFKNQLSNFPKIKEVIDNQELLNKAKHRVFKLTENEFSAN